MSRARGEEEFYFYEHVEVQNLKRLNRELTSTRARVVIRTIQSGKRKEKASLLAGVAGEISCRHGWVRGGGGEPGRNNQRCVVSEGNR